MVPAILVGPSRGYYVRPVGRRAWDDWAYAKPGHRGREPFADLENGNCMHLHAAGCEIQVRDGPKSSAGTAAMAYSSLENVGSFLWSDKGSLLAVAALVVAEQTPCEFVSLRVADRGKRNESHLGMIHRALAPDGREWACRDDAPAACSGWWT